MKALRELYEAVMGSPFMYDTVRPWLLGGFDFREVYGWLEAGPGDTVFDVGCGTGDAMRYLAGFDAYHGFDVDARALARLKARNPPATVTLHQREPTPDDFAAFKPTKAAVVGVLHHLDDPTVVRVLSALAQAGTIARVVTLDPLYLDGHRINNLLGRLDRGRFVRYEAGYRRLIADAGFEIRRNAIISSRNGLARYFTTALEPAAIHARSPKS